MKPLTTEPSLVEPDHPFETREEAIDFALEFFGATILEVKQINKRGKTHFE